MNAPASAWSREPEHGSRVLVRLIVWLTLRFGWPVGQTLLYPVTAYFLLTLRSSRRASRTYLTRVLGRDARLQDVWRHFFTFASVILDRICFLSNRTERFRISVEGQAHLMDALSEGRGCLMLGSHLGSFEVLRAFGRDSPVPVKALMYRKTAGALSAVMEALDPAIGRDVIEIGAPEAMLRVRESLERGEIVGILADRAPDAARRGPARCATASFLGAKANIPTGPLALAAALEVPVVLFFGLRVAPRQYRIVFEPFATRVVLAGKERRGLVLQALAQRYAARLETHCRSNPFNWFNFFDFWERTSDVASPGSVAQPPAPHGWPSGSGTVVSVGADR